MPEMIHINGTIWPTAVAGDGECRESGGFDMDGATVDSHLADQIILYKAPGKGESFCRAPEITSHQQTNAAIIKRFLPVRIDMDIDSEGVRVAGTGLSPRPA